MTTPSDPAERVRVLVTLEEGAGGSEPELVDELHQAGMSVEEVNAVLGIVTGTVERAAIDRLASLPGVVAVEPEGEVTI